MPPSSLAIRLAYLTTSTFNINEFSNCKKNLFLSFGYYDVYLHPPDGYGKQSSFSGFAFVRMFKVCGFLPH